MSLAFIVYFKISRLESEQSFNLACPYPCRSISKSYHGLRMHIIRQHNHESSSKDVLAQIQKLDRMVRKARVLK